MFLAAPAAVKLAPFVAPAPAAVALVPAWRLFEAGGPIRAGQMVAIGADGKVRAADTGEYQWMKRFSNWSTDPTERLLYEIMKGKAST
jgi:hypothetical protein